MIVDFIVSVILAILQALFGLMPTVEVTLDSLQAGAGWAFVAGGIVNDWIPLDVAVVCVGVLIAFTLGVQAWALIVWVYNKLPLKGT